MARSLAVLLAVAAVATARASPGAATQVSERSASSEGARIPLVTPAWLDVFANEVPKGAALVYLSTDDAWVASEDLDRIGFVVTGGERIERGGRSLVSLRSLGQLMTYRVDEAALALRITARQPLLGRTLLDLNQRPPPAGLLRREGSSAYLNWGVTADSEERRAASSELGVAFGPALLVAGATADETNGVVRGLTTLYVDDVPRLIRWAVGDLYATSVDPLGGAALVLGGSVGRNFALDPYLVVQPYPRTSIFSATPSTLEVWVDDTLVRRAQVQPGTIDLENIPANAGLSQIRTVLRDAFGREESASTYALMGSTALRPGLVDWSVAAGARRERFGVSSFDYGRPLGIARLRAGLTRAITAGGRLEGGDALASGGLSATLATALGELEANVAASRDAGDPGAAAALVWRRTSRVGSVGAMLRWDSGRYANASLAATADRPIRRATLTGSVPLTARISILADASLDRARDGGESGRAFLRAMWSLPRGAYVAASVGRAFAPSGRDDTQVLVTLTAPVPGRMTAELQGGGGNAGRYGQASLTRPLTRGPSVGYRLGARAGDGAFGAAELQAQDRWGRLELRHQELDPWAGARERYSFAQVSSGLVLVDGRLLVTRPVEGSFAVVKVDDAKGVRVLHEGNEIGRTDGDGEVVVTDLLPYQANRIGIRDTDLPLDYRVDELERVIAPRERGGTLERFRAGPVRAITGRLVLRADGEEVTPAWGEVAVELPGRRASSPVGDQGLFWLEDVPPGTHDALLRWEGKLCRFAFEVPAGAKGTVDLGTVRCDQLL